MTRRINENTLYSLYRTAPSGSEKDQLEAELIHLLTYHALAIIWQVLKEPNRRDLANWCAWLAIRDHEKFEGRDGASFTTYYHHIVVNACRSELRSKIRLRTREGTHIESVPEPFYDPTQTMNDEMEIEGLVDELPSHERELVRLHLAGHNGDEIGKRLGISEGAVRLRLMRLRERLRDTVSEQMALAEAA